MTAQRPDQFARSVQRTRIHLDSQLRQLVELYRIAHDASLERVVRESAGKVMSGSASDPTAAITGDPLDKLRPGIQAAIRRTLERAAKQLAELENSVHAIEREIAKSLDRLDPKDGFDPLRYPISVSNADLDELQAAQQRRKERGEG